MNFLMISKEGDGLGMAHKIVREGNSCRVWIKNPRYELSSQGIVDRVESWRPSISWADCIIVDMVGFGHLKQLFKDRGRPVIGCDPFLDIVELDRGKGVELLRRSGIRIPKTWTFNTPEEAKGSEISNQPIVLKPYGNIETAKTYIITNPKLLDHALSTYSKNQKFIAQEYIEGVEISTEGWFNGRDWIQPFNHTFEEKRFLEGDLGPNTGCMGNVVMSAGDSRLVKETLVRLTPYLRKAGIVGPIDINCMVNETGAYALELTCRFGYDAIEALTEGLKEPLSDVLFETATGTKKSMKLTTDFMIAVRLSVPPWPSLDSNQDSGAPILGLTEENLKHVFLTDVYIENGVYKTAGGDGVILKATARGIHVHEARRRVYRTLDNIEVQDKQYRLDIGKRVDSDLSQLRSWGYL